MRLPGLSRQVIVAFTWLPVVMGTPQYMAPEQIESPASVDHRADIFGLGSTDGRAVSLFGVSDAFARPSGWLPGARVRSS